MVPAYRQGSPAKDDGNQVVIPEMPKEQRPACPACSGTWVTSNGPKWHCRRCGKQWVKIKAAPRRLPSDRPPCPDCNGREILSHGTEWHCKLCGRRYSKVKRR